MKSCGSITVDARRRSMLAAWGAGCLGAALPLPACAAGTPPRPAMRRGVNLTHWFDYERNQTVAPDEMQSLAAAGFDHVRVPFDPIVLGWAPGRLPDLDGLRTAVDRLLKAGLEVVIDLHMVHETKQRIEREPRLEAELAALWTAVARRFADAPVERVALELYNEPQYYGRLADRWPPLQAKLLAAVRAETPRHCVLLTGARGGNFEGLSALEPVDDPNVVYVVHCYLPYLFTHQGIAWMDERYTTAGLYTGLPYPASLVANHPPVLRRFHPRAASELQAYRDEDWGELRIDSVVAPAAEWGRRHGVAVVCNEFGVIRANVDPSSRYRWIGDMRRTFERHGIGWAIWDYTDIFGITVESGRTRDNQRPPGAPPRSLEPAARAALGLKAAA